MRDLHAGVGYVADPGFEDSRVVPVALLELDGFSGPDRVEAFVLVWMMGSGDESGSQAALFVRVAENEVVG